ncbi:MAG: hypothetical protein ACERK6_11145, partial [Candidatus Aminicenantaceae bacterium]
MLLNRLYSVKLAPPLLVLMLALAAPTGLCGQDQEGAQSLTQKSLSEFQNRRQLNGHTFMPSRWVGQPFIAGWLRMMAGGGSATGLKVPVLSLSGEQQGISEGDITALLLDVEYQHRFGSWLAVRVGATGAANIGADQVTAIAQGIKAQYGFNLGTTIKLLRSQKVMLSGSGDIRFNQVYAYNLLRFVRNVINNGLSQDNTLLDKGMSNIYTAGLRFAYSPSRWFGFAALAEGGYGTPFLEGQDNDWVGSFAVSVDYDLGAGTRVPLGFQTFVRWSNFNDLYPEISDNILNTGLVLGYTGVENFYA